MDIICAWCNKKIGEKDGQGVEGKSHGICDDCLNRYFPHHADGIRETLEVESIEKIYQGGGDKRGKTNRRTEAVS